MEPDSIPPSSPSSPGSAGTSNPSPDSPRIAPVAPPWDSERPDERVEKHARARDGSQTNARTWLESWDHGEDEETGNLSAEQAEQVANHAAMALRVARRYARGRRLAGLDRDELESTALWTLIRAARHHRPERGPFLPYAASAIRHACANLARREAYRIEHFVHWNPSGRHDPPGFGSRGQGAARWTSRHPRAPGESSEERATRLEDHEALRRAVERLPETQRCVIQGRLAGDPPRVIAQALGLTHRQVYRLYNRALVRLRRQFR